MLERDGHVCVVGRLFGLEPECHPILDVHHRVPREDGGSDDDDNLYVLCRRHHPMIEALARRMRHPRWIRCPHRVGVHVYPGAREACEANLNRRARRRRVAA